jgi:uncharacterized protein YjiS (DUF1127 family)
MTARFDRSDDFLLAAHGIAPLPITPGRFRRWIGRAVERWTEAEARNGYVERLRAMPDYLLKDIGLTRDKLR